MDPTLQDNVVIESGIFTHIYHIGCAFDLHSIINNGLILIPGGQDLSRKQTVFFLPIDPRDKNHKNPEYIDFSVPRRAKYVPSAWPGGWGPRQVHNRRRRPRKGPEPACVQTPCAWGGTRREGRMN